MQIFGLLSLLITIAVIGWWLTVTGPTTVPSPDNTPAETTLDPVIEAEIAAHADRIQLTTPQPNGYITSPLTITGQARGGWYFEASFPVVLTNWDGLIIAEHYATAQGEWMTENFVPFTASLTFLNPYQVGDPEFMRRGSLILKKDNPSGLPEHDDALEIPVLFTATGEVISTPSTNSSYHNALNAAENAARSLE